MKHPTTFQFARALIHFVLFFAAALALSMILGGEWKDYFLGALALDYLIFKYEVKR